jgi:hypothetical protein
LKPATQEASGTATATEEDDRTDNDGVIETEREDDGGASARDGRDGAETIEQIEEAVREAVEDMMKEFYE